MWNLSQFRHYCKIVFVVIIQIWNYILKCYWQTSFYCIYCLYTVKPRRENYGSEWKKVTVDTSAVVSEKLPSLQDERKKAKKTFSRFALFIILSLLGSGIVIIVQGDTRCINGKCHARIDFLLCIYYTVFRNGNYRYHSVY